ncbi:type IV secretion protein Rhs [Niastella koreensis]|uniref:Rhs element Vgr protein n=2 Tax=Niastella koreensis TaxID=354356 RepID=G8T6M2_NIAKG|nr:type VI secretion system tip protein VgrG [Niastella koreensis]AEV96867.1 Rhs element Vgr protein [Niastella koreensis GR20-10]OQP49213.1 type IV secretion protein Rhs [Niastella koreensis]
MPNERTIPSDKAKTVVTTTLLSDGTEVTKKYQVLSITVNKEVNRIPVATLIILDGEPAKESFEISSKPEFEPGKELEIKCGYRNDEETIFKGIVIKHSIKVRKQNSVLVVECKDEAVKMTVGCKSKYFTDTKDSDVIEELINGYGLQKDVATTSVQHKQLVQYNVTDWDYILCRCDVNGLLCIPDDGTIKIGKPEFSGASSLTIQYGATVHDLDAEIDARLQYKSVKGSMWDYTNQELLSDVEATDPGVPDAGNLTPDALADVLGEAEFRLIHSGKIEEPELQALVDAKMMKHRLAKIRGRVRIDGTAAVKPGQLIELKGVGERFEGKLFVTGIRQEIEKGDWQTVIQFGVNPEWFAQTYEVQQPPAAAMLPAISGLQIGVVTQLQDDPDGEDRIKVRLPVIHDQDEGIWCRVSSLDAGDKRGMFFRPEVNDEVIVGFINNDPRHAIVLGMLNSSAKPAPLQASDDNNEKGYVSRSEMKMIFNDDKKSLQIETPAGNKLLISEDEKKIHLEDQNGNKFTMSEDGITIESVKDINLKAKGDIKAEASANVNIKGSAQTKVEGSGGAELSSGGSTTVKGATVMIN